jgi:hypothetical protein
LGEKELFHCRLVVSFDARERSVPEPLCQRGVLAALVLRLLWTESGILKNQGAYTREIPARKAEPDMGFKPDMGIEPPSKKSSPSFPSFPKPNAF